MAQNSTCGEILTLMQLLVYVSFPRSSHSSGLGLGRSGVTSSPCASSSASTFLSTSGCWVIMSLQANNNPCFKPGHGSPSF